MTRVCIDVTTYHNNDDDGSSAPYSYRGTTSGSVNRVFVSTDDYDWSYEGFETELTGELWAVYAEYMTGDTFGSDYRACVVGVTATEDEAVALMDEAEAFKGYGQLSNGFYVPWNGYFEHLIALNVTEVESRKHRRTY